MLAPTLTASLLGHMASAQAAPPAQTLRIAVGQDPGKLNPHDYSSNFVALSAVYEGLLKVGANGKIEPSLARTWAFTDAGKTLTFKLRPGVQFTDGTPMNSVAVAWNFKRWIGVKNHNWLNVTNTITAVQTPDPLTVVLKFSAYNDSVLHELALTRPVRLLSPKSVDAQGNFVKAIGTGPWQVAEIVAGQRLSLKPNANYWDKSYWGAAGPGLSTVRFDVIPDPQTRVSALLAGQVDVIGGEYLGTIPLDSLPTLRANPNFNIVTTPGSTTFILQTHYQAAPWNDARVRRAINAAIDRPTISRSLFQGLAQPSAGIMPSTVPFVVPGQPATYAYDPALAARLLQDAGWLPGPDGIRQKAGKPLSFTLLAQEDVYPQSKLLAEVLQSQLRKIGMDLKIEIVNNAAFYGRIQRGEFDLATNLTWGAPYDPFASLVTQFKSFEDKAASSSSSNAIYSDAALNRLVSSALDARNDDQRRVRYAAIWRYVDEQAAGIPLLSMSRLYAVSNKVSGLRLGSTEYELDFSRTRVGR